MPLAMRMARLAMQRPPGMSSDEDEDDEDGAAERRAEEAESKKLKYAGYFDDFNRVVYAVRPFVRDDLNYRKERATEMFNRQDGRPLC